MKVVAVAGDGIASAARPLPYRQGSAAELLSPPVTEAGIRTSLAFAVGGLVGEWVRFLVLASGCGPRFVRWLPTFFSSLGIGTLLPARLGWQRTVHALRSNQPLRFPMRRWGSRRYVSVVSGGRLPRAA